LKADDSFYASLYNTQYKYHKVNNVKDNMFQETSNNAQDLPKLDVDKVASFVETIKYDYENTLTTFLYNVNRNTNPLVCMRSGTKIRMQVKSVKHRKLVDNKKNSDPHIISARKVWAVGKKGHRLSENTKLN
ncbi:15462_t:CDS:2, partial [Dentiscutata heterogama]